ncbi:Endonuclease/exonuclease/phosphatase [Haematococcus lacustris]
MSDGAAPEPGAAPEADPFAPRLARLLGINPLAIARPVPLLPPIRPMQLPDHFIQLRPQRSPHQPQRVHEPEEHDDQASSQGTCTQHRGVSRVSSFGTGGSAVRRHSVQGCEQAVQHGFTGHDEQGRWQGSFQSSLRGREGHQSSLRRGPLPMVDLPSIHGYRQGRGLAPPGPQPPAFGPTLTSQYSLSSSEGDTLLSLPHCPDLPEEEQQPPQPAQPPLPVHPAPTAQALASSRQASRSVTPRSSSQTGSGRASSSQPSDGPSSLASSLQPPVRTASSSLAGSGAPQLPPSRLASAAGPRAPGEDSPGPASPNSRSAWSDSGTLTQRRSGGALQLRLHVITFNMGEALPETLPDTLLSAYRGGADLYVVGSQESCPLPDWEKLLQDSLGPAYVKVAQESLTAINVKPAVKPINLSAISLILYARQEVAHLITEIQTSFVACGVGNVLHNKGGVAVSCRVAGVRLLLVTCHLAAHDEYVERRNADYHRIVSGLFASPAAANSPSTRSKSVAKAPSRHVSIVSPGPPPRAARKLKLDTSQTSPAAPSIAAHSAMSRSFLSALGPAAEPAPAHAPPSYTLASLSAASTVSSHHPGLHHLLTHCSSTAMDQLPQRPGGLHGSDGGQGSPLLLDSPLRSLSRPTAFSVPSSPLRTRGQVAPLLASYDVVLWGGDLNYRIQGTPEVVRHLVETGMAEVLHANDQLRLQMRKGKVLQGLEEQAIHFPPTFKYVAHSEEYSLKRIPSWTDRILHACNAKPTICCLTPLYYSAVGELTSSDHRPVIAGYDLYITRPQSPSHKAAVPSLADNDNAAGLPRMPKQDQSPGWTLAASKTM